MEYNLAELTRKQKEMLLIELRCRRHLAEIAITTLQQEAKDDPRQKGALANYRQQLYSIQKQILEVEQEIIEPHDVIIGLKAADLSAKVPNINS